MNLNRLKTLIAIALIATLILVILVRENQHSESIIEYLDREIQKEQGRLETYREFVKDYNEFQDSYRGLYEKYNEHYIYWQKFVVTGYSANDSLQGTNNIVATTFNLDYTRVNNLPIVATDPEIIPLYSIVEIKDMGAFISLDTGVKGNRIDILFSSKEEAIDFGRQNLMVRVIR